MTVYTTSYCNKGHRLEDGRPVDHECYVLPPKALQLEREGDVASAIEVIDAAKPLKMMRRGVPLEEATKKTFIVTLKAQAEVTGTIRVEAQNDLEAGVVANEKAKQDYVTWGQPVIREETVRKERVFLVP